MHEVMAAMATLPWSMTWFLPVRVTTVGRVGGFGEASVPPFGGRLGVVVVDRWRIARWEGLGGRLVEGGMDTVAVETEDVGQDSLEVVARLGEQHPVLRATGACQRRDDDSEVELDQLGVRRGVPGVEPHSLVLGVLLDEPHLRLGTPGEAQVAQGLVVDGKESAGRAELRAHVGDRESVGQGRGNHAGTEELHELTHHAVVAQDLGDGQNEVGGGSALGQLAVTA